MNLGVAGVSRASKTGGIGLSRKPADQAKNFFSNKQKVNTLSFSAFFAKNDNANKIDLTRQSLTRQSLALLFPHPQILLR